MSTDSRENLAAASTNNVQLWFNQLMF